MRRDERGPLHGLDRTIETRNCSRSPSIILLSRSSPSAIHQNKLEGKVAIITGGASGVGESTGRLFIRHDAKVIIADIQDTLGLALCEELGSDQDNLSYVHCDVTQEPDVQNVVDTAISRYRKLDIMFNNAGI
ncbi:hypothetical protein CDL15_Pgr003220 [Punica granatum]|uniref:Uncharacterized protein n=1 Tax=Punica granatum TaxID=22663 RepID=A0A218X2U2_PUNGR|nr:hypothetical protein CDL15_Pgr003220 [Punica granatum]